MRGVLKSLVAAEVELRSGLFVPRFIAGRMVSNTRFAICCVPVLPATMLLP